MYACHLISSLHKSFLLTRLCMYIRIVCLFVVNCCFVGKGRHGRREHPRYRLQRGGSAGALLKGVLGD